MPQLPDEDYDMDYPEEEEEDEEDEDNEDYEEEGGDIVENTEQMSVHMDLNKWERRLQEEVDEDFFQDPREFHTLQRVIDVLGAQMDDAPITNTKNLFQVTDRDILRNNNPAYRALKKQQRVVEEAIEHMSVRYCADLNSSVVQVGKVARQFSDAVSMVRHLRRQVRDVKETLGSSNPVGGVDASNAQAASMSLRELWLKKLECEAVLSLLEKMDIIRAAPGTFDMFVHPPGPCRIGAAVVTLSKALDIAFSPNVASVSALQNITKQITDRKQLADQIIWDTLFDVIYLRTGNGALDGTEDGINSDMMNGSVPNSGNISSSQRNNGMKNPFITKHRLTLAHTDKDDDDDDDSMASWFSQESVDHEKTGAEFASSSKMVIPGPLLEAELDLVADEQRCLEESMMNGEIVYEMSVWDELDHHGHSLPRYSDHVLPLRILVECLAKLGRLDDVERTLNESIGQEIRKLAQKEQAKTFSRLDKQNPSRRRRQDLRDFRRHLTGLLSSFGCVMIRLSHLTQILRYRIANEKHLYSYKDKSAAMRSVLVAAYDTMQKELKDFLVACIRDDDEEDDHDRRINQSRRAKRSNEPNDSHGLFSLGITEAQNKKESLSMQPESRANQMQQNASKFVASVLMPKTNTTPQSRHALEFRRSVAVWTSETDALQKELSDATGEDTSSLIYNSYEEEKAIHFLDDMIKKQLIPVLQHEAISGTTKALEHEDAFLPVIDRNLYGRSNSNEPQDVDMCIACQALYNSTGPLFMALHRLPKDEKMYLHLIGVLEHTILTFISRVNPRVSQLCSDKTALHLLMEPSQDGKDKSFSAALERRKAFSQLLNAYADGELLEAGQLGETELRETVGTSLVASASDTKGRNGGLEKSNAHNLDMLGGVEKEEQVFAQELVHLKGILEFSKDVQSPALVCCSDEELLNACSLAHSLLKVSTLLDSRLKARMHSSGTFEKALTSTRALREAIKTIKAHGLKVAKFCRVDMMLQAAIRLRKICRSSTIVAKDAVRIPSCVNDLGEYLTGASDNLREAGGNAVTAYAFSSLEQYIPLFLMQTVRVIARGEGIVSKTPITLNGVEALDRSGSVLYRDLKSATKFDNSFWEDELAAISFERSASFMAMMEVEMEELEAYYRGNHQEFSDADFTLMFSMNGPRRKGDIGRFHLLKKKMRMQ